MAEIGRVGIRLPSAIKQGDVIRVKSLVIHPMELVQRDKQGSIIRKNYNFIHTVAVKYNGKEIIPPETTRAGSRNPISRFPPKEEEPGMLHVSFLTTLARAH